MPLAESSPLLIKCPGAARCSFLLWQAVTQQQLPAAALLAAGMLSSTTAQLVSYPLGLVRTRLQVSRNLMTLQSHFTPSEMRS